MAIINQEVEKALVSFMDVKGLDIKTKNKYLEFYHKFANIYSEINTKNVDNFLLLNRSSPARAMIKNLLTAIRRWDFPQEMKESIFKIDIPTATGIKEKKLPKFITREEINILDKGIGNDNELVDGRTRIMMLVQFWGGLRVEELIGLTYDDLLFEEYKSDDKFKIIKIRSSSAKFKKERTAYIPNDIFIRLKKWLKLRYDNEAICERRVEETDTIWGIKESRYKKLMYKWTLKLLGKRYNTHAFRHGRGTDLKRVDGWDIASIKEYLGHADISSTQIYVHLSNEDIKNKLES